MGFTPEQIKGRIKSVAKQNNADARTLMRIYMMERFLERLAQSEYRDNFIIKGGILVTAMIGVAHRSTMDIDTSMKNLNLSAEDALRVVNQVKDIDLDDGVSFEVKDVSNIMDEMEYPGIRVTMNANVGRLITPLKIDISTGDVITPRAIEFNYDLLLEDRSISLYVRLIFELALQGNRTGTIAKILNEKQIPTPAAYHVAESHVYSEQKAWDLQRSHWTSGTVYHVLKNEKYKGTYVGAKFIMPVPCKHRVLRAPLEQQVRIEDSHAAIVTPEEFEQAQMVIMLQHGKHQAGNYTKHQYPLKGKVYCGYCQKLMKYRVLKKLGPSFNCRFSATAVDSPCKRIPISEELLEHIVRNALTAQIKQAEYVLEILHERERKALICFSALERQEEKLSAEKAEIVKQRVALYEQYADGNMSKEEFIRQRDAYRVQEDEKMEQIQRLRTEKNQAFQPVKRDTDHLQTVMSTVEEAGDVMYLSQNVVETFIDRIEVFNDEHVKIHFTFENVLADYAE